MNGASSSTRPAEARHQADLGLEAYFVDDRTVREGKIERNHLTLLAASDEGFKQPRPSSPAPASSRASTAASRASTSSCCTPRRGRHRALRLPGVGSCRASSRAALAARAHLDDLVQIFGPEDVYFEVQRNGIAEQEQVNEAIAKFAQEMGRPLVATADVHYLRKEDYHHHAALLCVQTKSTLAAPKMSFDTNEFYLKSSEEMAESFATCRRRSPPRRDRRALRRHDRARQQLIPRFDTPDGESEATTCAARRRRPAQALRRPDPRPGRERADMELGVIDNMGFNAYFLIVWDFVNYAKSNGIAVGPGRGSAAGSIVAYSLRITDVDPLRYDLLFERFLNAERVSMPDIDIDFSVRGRERVIRYVTRSTAPSGRADHHLRQDVPARRDARRRARARARLRRRRQAGQADPDPSRAARRASRTACSPATDLAARSRATRSPSRSWTSRRARGASSATRRSTRPRRDLRPHLTDIVRSSSPTPAWGGRREGLPHGHPVLDEADRGDRAAQDGLPRPAQPRRDRGRADDHRALVRQPARHGDAAARRREDLRDDGPRRRGRACSSSSPRACARRCKKVQPTEFEDLVALVALYRPGAMDQIPPTRAASATPTRSPTSTTACADHRGDQGRDPLPGAGDADRQVAGGFSGPKADDLRKAIGKKNREAMAKLKPSSSRAAARRARAGRDRVAVGDQREVADYSFNKSHAACYALISYRTAWLKANYPPSTWPR
jgi:DNA polymerase-3 subunit alpha